MYYLFFTVHPQHSKNVNIFYKEPFDDSERCNWYGKDGNTGPEYSCNHEGQIVAIRRWDTEVLSVCNITAYGGKLSSHILYNAMPIHIMLCFSTNFLTSLLGQWN